MGQCKPRTLGYWDLRREVNAHAAEAPADVLAEIPAEMPRTRADCVDGPRPCPFVGCRHNLYLDVTPNGSLKLNWPDLEPWELQESCALDVADKGPQHLETIGRLLQLTRERVRQLEGRYLRQARKRALQLKLVRQDDVVGLGQDEPALAGLPRLNRS